MCENVFCPIDFIYIYIYIYIKSIGQNTFLVPKFYQVSAFGT